MAGLQALFGDQAQNKVDLRRLYDPRIRSAQALGDWSTSGAPAQGGWGEALARILGGGISGYQMKQANKDLESQEQAKQQTIADALALGRDQPAETQSYNDGTVIDWNERKGNVDNMVTALMGNPETASIGMGLQANLMQNQIEKQNKLDQLVSESKLKAIEPMTPYQQAQIDIDRQKLERGGSGGGISYTMPDGTVLQIGGSGNKAMDTQLGKNLANKAVPDDNPVAKLTSTLNMAAEAKRLNDTASGGYPAKAQQVLGRATNDALMTEDMMKGRDAYSKLESIAATMGAEALKPLMGSAQLSNVDVATAKTAASFNPDMTTRERGERINQLEGILTRKRDLAAAEQEAARRGMAFGEPEIRQFYLERGINYDTGMPVETSQPAVGASTPSSGSTTVIQSKPQQFDGLSAFPRLQSAEEYKRIPSGTKFMAPDGSIRVKP